MRKGILLLMLWGLLWSCSKEKEAECEAPPLGDSGTTEADAPQEPSPKAPRPNRRGEASIAFFYHETCPTCDEYIKAKEIESLLREAAVQGYFPWEKISLTSTNVLQDEHLQQLKDYIEEKGFPDVSRSLPVIFVNSELVVGYEEIEKLLEGLTEY